MPSEKLPLLEWVLERFENCGRIAREKDDPADRDSWLEDADYFRQILAILAEPRHTLSCDMAKHPNCTRCNCGSQVTVDAQR